MSLIVDINNFFIQYDEADKNIEEYGLDLSKKLHRLAEELDEKECKEINKLCSTLETLSKKNEKLREDARSLPTKEKTDNLDSNSQTIRTNISDFRHGNILKRYKEKFSERKSTPRSKTVVPGVESRSSTRERPSQQLKETLLEMAAVAADTARQKLSDASEEERSEFTTQLFSVLSGQKPKIDRAEATQGSELDMETW